METGFKRNLLAELLDSAGRGVVLMALGIGWFVFLWGLNLPALLAGIALGTLLLLMRRLYRQTTLARRETALRCRIGGELLLEKMLLSEAKEAHFQAALLLDSGSPGVYDAAISQYKAICSYLKWEDKGIVTIPGMKQKGDMAQSADLEKVCQLARSL